MAFSLLLATGPALVACSDESSDDTAAASSPAGSAAATSSAVPDAGTSTSTESAEAGDSSTGGSSTPVDLATVILGPDDAPAGFTWVDTSGSQADAETLAAMSELIDMLTFSPASCQEQMRSLADPDAAAGQGGVSATYTSDTDEGAALLVAVGPKSEGDPHACDNATATGTVGGVEMNMVMTSTDLGLSIDGATNVVSTRTETTVSAQGQSQTSTQSTVIGEVNGVWFSASSQGDVDQDVLEALAQKQADRLQG
ncbi:hypothetical protein [Corynebacterium terpenotabidum]|uniref:Uncharacterized protein n=1 Tax=Corynebacterium terpenotabidum Y-11 TaxID=1200352 RepID=S4XFW2_9CORY|nr:hypothetical protein [Corynebacterium terpenotabidum]AGP30535.1 hypothetical protein A606_04430 [Corynebacterium terpenotabidum Y-11]